MELPASIVESARPEALPEAEATVLRPPARDWAFDALTWCALRLGRVGPVRRAIARHMEARIRARGDLPASALRHPVAVEQDKIALGLAVARRPPSGGSRAAQLGAPALRALLRNLYSGVFVHRGGTSAKDRFRARHGQTPGDFLVISPGKACNLRCVGLLRELRRPPREARLGDLRAHGARGARHLGHARLRDQRRGAARLARRRPLRPRPRRALPGLLLRDVHERDADRRRGREADGPARQRQPRPVHRGDEGAHRRPARRRRLRQGPRGHGAAAAGGRHHRRVAHRHPRERRRDPLRRGGRDLLRSASARATPSSSTTCRSAARSPSTS